MKTADYPDTILDLDTIRELLNALGAGVIDMAYFPQIYFPRIGAEPDCSSVTPEEASRFMAIHAKIRYDTGGQVMLSRNLKIRLLSAIRAGRINLQADFSELCRAFEAVNQDWSAVSEEEQQFSLAICRQINR